MNQLLKNKKILAIVCSILTTFIYSCHYLVAKEMLKDIDPLGFSAFRGILGGLALCFLFKGQIVNGVQSIPADKRNKLFIKIIFIGFLGFFINQIFFMYGLKNTTPLNVAIITNTIPLVSTLLAILFSLEMYRLKKMIGVVMGFLLVVLLMFLSGKKGGDSTPMGDFFIFMNVVSFTLAFTLVKKILKENVPYALISAGMLISGGIFLSFLSFREFPNLIEYTFSSFRNFNMMFFEVIVSTSFAYLLNFLALKYLSPSQTTVFIYLQPLFSAGLDYSFYGILPSMRLIPIFIGIIIAGSLVLSRDDNEVSSS